MTEIYKELKDKTEIEYSFYLKEFFHWFLENNRAIYDQDHSTEYEASKPRDKFKNRPGEGILWYPDLKIEDLAMGRRGFLPPIRNLLVEMLFVIDEHIEEFIENYAHWQNISNYLVSGSYKGHIRCLDLLIDTLQTIKKDKKVQLIKPTLESPNRHGYLMGHDVNEVERLIGRHGIYTYAFQISKKTSDIFSAALTNLLLSRKAFWERSESIEAEDSKKSRIKTKQWFDWQKSEELLNELHDGLKIAKCIPQIEKIGSFLFVFGFSRERNPSRWLVGLADLDYLFDKLNYKELIFEDHYQSIIEKNGLFLNKKGHPIISGLKQSKSRYSKVRHNLSNKPPKAEQIDELIGKLVSRSVE